MFLHQLYVPAGTIFVLHFLLLRGDLGAWWRNEEFRFYVKLLAVAVLLAAAFLFSSGTYEKL